jgi:hypothetical protein
MWKTHLIAYRTYNYRLHRLWKTILFLPQTAQFLYYTPFIPNL